MFDLLSAIGGVSSCVSPLHLFCLVCWCLELVLIHLSKWRTCKGLDTLVWENQVGLTIESGLVFFPVNIYMFPSTVWCIQVVACKVSRSVQHSGDNKSCSVIMYIAFVVLVLNFITGENLLYS